MHIIKNSSITPQVEYIIINLYTHEKIDLSICENTKIDIYANYELSDEILNLYTFVKK